MFRHTLPLVRRLSAKSPVNNLNQSRNVWGLIRPPSDVQKIMRDMDRRMEAFEREFFKAPSFRSLSPRLIPVEGVPSPDAKFRIDVDVSGFQPEDISLSINNGRLRIEAKLDKKGEDGSTFQQHLVREFTLPENLDVKTVESLLHNNGVLTIEAATKPEGAQKLKITGETEAEVEKEKIESKN